MLRIIVDSGSSVKEDEKEKYGVDIIPLRLSLGNEEFSDGDISFDHFYDLLINKKLFPKTSLPDLNALEEKVNKYVSAGDRVLIITISSCISGTWNTIRMLFEGNPSVMVYDSSFAVGGIRELIIEANKYKDRDFSFIEEKLNELRKRTVIVAIPETLEYLKRGGRLSSKEAMVGNLLHIKPLIGFKDGKVVCIGKKIGIKKAMQALVDILKEEGCDTSYPLIPSYTYDDSNLKELMAMVPEELKKSLSREDNLDPAIACHWGPGAFGFIFVKK